MAVENLSPFLWCLTLVIFIYASGHSVNFALFFAMLCLKCPLRISAKGFSDFPITPFSCNSNMGAQVMLGRIYNSFVLNLLKLPRSNPEEKNY